MESVNSRQSNIELLKVIAIFVIISFHVAHTLVGFYEYEKVSSLQKIFIWLFRNIGTIGNCIFIICSSWFLFDNEHHFSHFKLAKVIQILLNSCFISIIIFFLYHIITKEAFTYKDIIFNIFPDIFRNVWFVPCYVLFYCICPLLNASIGALNRKNTLSCVWPPFFCMEY